MSPISHQGISQTIGKSRLEEMEKGKRSLVFLSIIFSLASFSLIAPTFFPIERSPKPSFAASRRLTEQKQAIFSTIKSPPKKRHSTCATMKKNSVCCDHTSPLTDFCVLRGSVRTNPSAAAIILYNNNSTSNIPPIQKIRPYPRKYDNQAMREIHELSIIVKKRPTRREKPCDIIHKVPAIIFSTGGGDLDREFSKGIIPLYLTSRRYHRRVVFLIVNYRSSWRAKYEDIFSRLSAYPPIDFFGDNRTRCFQEAIVGLRNDGEFLADSNQNIIEFKRLLEEAYRPRILSFERGEREKPVIDSAPKIVIVFGGGLVENERELIGLCKEMGYRVKVLRLEKKTELAKIYWLMNSSDVVLNVGGSSLAHLLFLRAGSVFINVIAPGENRGRKGEFEGLAKEIGAVYMSYENKVSEDMMKKVNLDLNGILGSLTNSYQLIVQRILEEDNSSLRWNENWLPRKAAE